MGVREENEDVIEGVWERSEGVCTVWDKNEVVFVGVESGVE